MTLLSPTPVNKRTAMHNIFDSAFLKGYFFPFRIRSVHRCIRRQWEDGGTRCSALCHCNANICFSVCHCQPQRVHGPALWRAIISTDGGEQRSDQGARMRARACIVST